MLIVKTIQYIRPTNSMKYGIIDITYLVWGGALKTRDWIISGAYPKGRIPSKRSKQRNRIGVAKIHQTHNISCITENKQEIRRGCQTDRPAR